MPFVWATDCHSTLFFYHVSNAAITSYEKKRELSEYKAIYMIKENPLHCKGFSFCLQQQLILIVVYNEFMYKL